MTTIVNGLPVRSATSDTARMINRCLILNLIRTRQPISRADLARASGLQRSTVSSIAEDLITEGWIVEGSIGRLPRGRRPTYLQLNGSRQIIGIDIRPTNITIAVADINGRFRSQELFPTPSKPKAAITEIVRRVRKLMAAERDLSFEGLGVSLPGRLDVTQHKLVFAPNLHWPEYDLVTPLREGTGLTVTLENAANSCALAETWYGDACPAKDLVVITISEGIGTGIWMNGQLLRGASGMTGEFGHISIDESGPWCSCGHRGCWEVFASNTAALRYYLDTVDVSRGPAYRDLLSLAGQGDAQAQGALKKQAAYLGRGAAVIVNGLAPERLTFVGELTRLWSLVGQVVEREVWDHSIMGKRVKLIAAGDGAEARLRGTLALVLQRHFGVVPIFETTS